MLVLLGLDVLRRLIIDRIHFHSHSHGEVRHFHAHSHRGGGDMIRILIYIVMLGIFHYAHYLSV
jgi:hypothetical protein